ncbi:MAG: NAD(P)H-quinone oxidoreductase, partial [bacterium]
MKSGQNMQAVVMESLGAPDVLKLGTWVRPEPGKNEILVKVDAAGINRADTLQRQGKYPPPKGASPVLGLEIAGRVEEVGDETSRWKRGDNVFGLLPGGGYAEFAIMHEDLAMPVPHSFSMIDAAAIPEVFLTAYQALLWHAKLQAGEYVLIHAGASGVGTAAIQLAREIGVHILVTASASKHAICLELGAEKVIDYKTELFDKIVLEYTKGRGVDAVIDFIAAPYYQQNISSLAVDGRLVILATMGGGKVSEIDLRQILAKRLSVIGSTLRSRELSYQIKLTQEFSRFA